MLAACPEAMAEETTRDLASCIYFGESAKGLCWTECEATGKEMKSGILA